MDACEICGTEKTVMMPQGDETIEEIHWLDVLLEYAVMHIRLRRRRQVARRSVATEPRSGRKRPSDEAEAWYNFSASRRSGYANEEEKINMRMGGG